MEHELQMLLKAPGNEHCADCKAIFPRYASITFAIFLCNRCYNIHRCMGAHITHTKSVGFDKWSYEEVGHMSSIGNTIANLYWEGFLSKLFSFQIAPRIIMLLWHSYFTFLNVLWHIHAYLKKTYIGVDESRCSYSLWIWKPSLIVSFWHLYFHYGNWEVVGLLIDFLFQIYQLCLYRKCSPWL